VAAPSLESISSSSVLVSWSAPRRPNGIITQYVIERRLFTDSFTSAPVTVTTASPRGQVYLYLDTKQVYQYVDDSPSLTPFTRYQYRVAAQTIAGLTYSPWTNVITHSASQYCNIAKTCYLQRSADNRQKKSDTLYMQHRTLKHR